jgi:competence protein ComEA
MSSSAPISTCTSHGRLAAVGLVFFAAVVWQAYRPQWSARPTELVAASPINLNAADRSQLMQIPGVGPAMADAILDHRQRHGRIETFEELEHLPGVGPKSIEKIRGWLTIGPGSPRTLLEPVEKLERKPTARNKSERLIDLNRASVEELVRLPGIGPKLAAAIVTERGRQRFDRIEDLTRVPGIGPKTLEKLRPLVCISD